MQIVFSVQQHELFYTINFSVMSNLYAFSCFVRKNPTRNLSLTYMIKISNVNLDPFSMRSTKHVSHLQLVGCLCFDPQRDNMKFSINHNEFITFLCKGVWAAWSNSKLLKHVKRLKAAQATVLHLTVHTDSWFPSENFLLVARIEGN